MPPERECEYWFLLYRLLLDIRTDSALSASVPWWNPRYWRENSRRTRRIFALVNAFHNLPAYGAQGWDQFDEERFWQDIAHYRSCHPEDERANYRELFERRLAGEDRLF